MKPLLALLVLGFATSVGAQKSAFNSPPKLAGGALKSSYNVGEYVRLEFSATDSNTGDKVGIACQGVPSWMKVEQNISNFNPARLVYRNTVVPSTAAGQSYAVHCCAKDSRNMESCRDVSFKIAGAAQSGTSPKPAPAPPPNTPKQDVSSCATLPAWKQGSYKPGDKVQSGGKIYQCKTGAASRWCGQKGYLPGIDRAAPNAWSVVGDCIAKTPPPNFELKKHATAPSSPPSELLPPLSKEQFIVDCYSSLEMWSRLKEDVRFFLAETCERDIESVGVYNPETAFLTTLGGALTPPSTKQAEKIIFDFLRMHPGLFGVSSPEKQLKFLSDRSHLEGSPKIYKYVQAAQGVSIYNGSLMATVDERGVLTSISNGFDSSFPQNLYTLAVNVKLMPEKVKEIVHNDLKMAPPELFDEKQTNASLLEKMKQIKPTLAYVFFQNSWRLVYQYLIVVWEPISKDSSEESLMKPASYEYWVDAQSGEILQKRDAADYCDDVRGFVVTPVNQLLGVDEDFAFRTCRGWEPDWSPDLHATTHYLEDHSHSGVIETYNIEGVSALWAITGYSTVWLPNGWPRNTPDVRDNRWDAGDGGKSESATVHWAAQGFRDFLTIKLGRDQIDGDWDIDIGSRARWTLGTASASSSFTFPHIHTSFIKTRHTGLGIVAHELMHIVTFWETPGDLGTGPWSDQSVNEHISELFAVFAQAWLNRDRYYPTLGKSPWCHNFDNASITEEGGLFNRVVQYANEGRSASLELLGHFSRGEEFDDATLSSSSCGVAASVAVGDSLCFHKSLEETEKECQPSSDTSSAYRRAAIPMRAEYLLHKGGNLYTGLDPNHFIRNVDSAIEEDARLTIQPIGMDRLMQISYQTVRARTASTMTYEDWAARQRIACNVELRLDYSLCCSVKNAYAAVGYGESSDSNCNHIPDIEEAPVVLPSLSLEAYAAGPWCFDSDNGFERNAKGYTIAVDGQGNVSREVDECWWDEGHENSAVVEYFCREEKILGFGYAPCRPDKPCFDGACIEAGRSVTIVSP